MTQMPKTCPVCGARTVWNYIQHPGGGMFPESIPSTWSCPNDSDDAHRASLGRLPEGDEKP